MTPTEVLDTLVALRLWDPTEHFTKIAAPERTAHASVEPHAGADRPPESAPATLDALRESIAHWPKDRKADFGRFMVANNYDRTDFVQVAAAIESYTFDDVHIEPVNRHAEPAGPEPVAALPTFEVDEGDPVGDAEVAAAGKRYSKLPDAVRSWVSATCAHVRLNPASGGMATMRRFEALRGLCELAEGGFDDDDIVRAICWHIHGDAVWQQIPAADIVASLDADGARRFARMCDAVTSSRDVALSYTSDGRAVLSPSVAAA